MSVEPFVKCALRRTTSRRQVLSWRCPLKFHRLIVAHALALLIPAASGAVLPRPSLSARDALSEVAREAAAAVRELQASERVVAARPTVRHVEQPLHTADLSDNELLRLWNDDPVALGSIVATVGSSERGRLINGVRLPEGAAWTVVHPEQAYGSEETIGFLASALTAVAEQFPGTPPMRVNDLSRPGGGHLRPHQTHQTGRDVDTSFYFEGGVRGGRLDMERNWAFIKALVTGTDLQVVLVDQSIVRQLHRHALAAGEDAAWLERIFNRGDKSLVRHASGHRDHFHLRFYNRRAQELGLRLAPLIAAAPAQATHRLGRGETLAEVAHRRNVDEWALRRLNRFAAGEPPAGYLLMLPLSTGGSSARPVEAQLVVPPRCLPSSRDGA